MKVSIRWLIKRDLRHVLNIEQDCFQHAWGEEDFLCCLRQRNCIGMVAFDEKHGVCGYMIYELHKSSLRLLNFAVHPHYWRTGVGTAMVKRLRDKLADQRREDITLEVRDTNVSAQLFFKSQGFWAERVLRDHYEECPGDAYAMRFSLNGRPAVYWGGRLSAYRPQIEAQQ